MSWMDKVAPTGQVAPQVEPVTWLDRASGRAPLPGIQLNGSCGIDKDCFRGNGNQHTK
jgi:hypothetical protein